MSFSQQTVRQKTSSRWNLWFERVMALAATLNLGLVLFDLSYISLHDFWLRGRIQVLGLTLQIPLPPITQWYDPTIKAIEPYRETQQYLDAVDRLEEQVSQTGLQSPQVATLLQELRRQSSQMIDNNPFALANKSGTLEKIKNEMRQHIYNTKSRKQSARQAFYTFWNQKYLSSHGWKQEIVFFDSQIRPLILTNYYRPIGENGQFIDNFWVYIDLPFVVLFGLEFLARTFYISRRHAGLSWIDAMLWRWYDIFLLLPFWRWLRVIPVTIRLKQAKLLNLERIQEQASQGFVATFAEELTEVIVIRVVSQIQGAIERGDITRLLFQNQQQGHSLITVNDINEGEAIAGLLVQLTIHQVLPKIQPDIEAIVRHNIEGILNQFPLYRGLQNLSGLTNLPSQLVEQLANQITTNAYNILVAATQEDPIAAKLSGQLVQHFTEVLRSEVQKEHRLDNIQLLLQEMLEEFKLNYLRRVNQEDIEHALEESRRLRSQLAADQTDKDPVLPTRAS